MDPRESSRSYTKRDIEDGKDKRGDRVADDEDLDGSGRRKSRSNKTRKNNNAEEAEDSERRKSSGDRIESRKRPGSSSRVASGDEDEYDTRKESRTKQVKKSQDDKVEKKQSSSYQDRDADSHRKSRDISGSKVHGTADESDRESSRKSGSKPSVHESSQSKSRSKAASSHDIEHEKTKDRDSRYAEKKDKSHGSREVEKKLKRRYDESDSIRKGDESNYVDKSESKSGRVSDVRRDRDRDRTSDVKTEAIDVKSKDGESNNDKAVKFSNGEEKRTDGEKSRSRGRPEAPEDDFRLDSSTREERSGGPRDDKPRAVRDKQSGLPEDTDSVSHKPSTRSHGEKIESHRHRPESDPINTDEDGRSRTSERSGREVRQSKRSWSPDRVGRRHPQSGDLGSDNERSVSLKGKERERESYRDDNRSLHNSWSDRNKDREGSKETWKRRHESNSEKDPSYVNVDYDHNIDWDSQRRDRERNDNDKLRNHSGYRKMGRNDGGKNLSTYGSGNRSSDMIEIRPTSLDYGRDGSESVFPGRKTETSLQTTGDDQWGHLPDDKAKTTDTYGPGDDQQERYPEEGSSMLDQNSGMSNIDMQGDKGRGQRGVLGPNRGGIGPGHSPSSISQSPFGNNPGSGNFNRMIPQGVKGSRLGRGGGIGGGRGRLPGRDMQRVGMPMPMMGSPFGPLGLQPGPMQPLGPNMPPGPGAPLGLGVFIPQYPGPNTWPGARGVVDMNMNLNMLSIPHGLSPVPHGPVPPRFTPNVVTGPNSAMFFNQQSPVRGVSPSLPNPSFNPMGALGRGMPNESKPLTVWTPPRTIGPPGKAPSRGEQNDYSQNFVDTGMRPQNYIRELELTNTVEDYPKLRELIQRKDEIVANSSSPPMYYKADLREFNLNPEFFGTKFDVILVDPPWEEYVHRAPGVADHMEYWTFEEISNLKIEAIADTPSFIFLWVGDGVGLEQGRQCLRKWGFRRCEDICWVKTNKSNATSGLRHDSHTLFQHSKEHCLMGIKGTVRRSTDGHIIHANIDTDIVIAEESPYGSTKKPEDLYRIIEHFSLGRRRIELFGEDHNIRSGWLTVGKELSSSNFNPEAYIRDFWDKEGKVWQGGGGRNPPPGAPHLVVTTPEIESLRPKSPPAKNQQPQQLQTSSITLTQTTTSSANRRPAVNSPQNMGIIVVNQEASGSTPSTPAQWAPPMGAVKAPEMGAGSVGTEEKFFDGYTF
ncbi:mRNA (2'-O-methyladenosine-N(6)-)-methyltransferase [Ranunculus cassubicifolius]